MSAELHFDITNREPKIAWVDPPYFILKLDAEDKTLYLRMQRQILERTVDVIQESLVAWDQTRRREFPR
jgi:hypothetical protein